MKISLTLLAMVTNIFSHLEKRNMTTCMILTRKVACSCVTQSTKTEEDGKDLLGFLHLIIDRVHDISQTFIDVILLFSETRQILAQVGT